MKQFTTFAWIFVVGLLVFAGLAISDNIRLKERFQLATSAPLSAAIPSSPYMVLDDGNGNLSSHPFPRGMIVIWSGAIADIPSGWALCDGNRGTPDLRGRFVLGPNAAAITGTNPRIARAVNDVGGAETVALEVAQMPRHRHYGGNQTNYDGTGNYGGVLRIDNVTGFPPDVSPKGYTGGTPPPEGSTRDAEGPGQAHNNMPPFLVLAYIMKL